MSYTRDFLASCPKSDLIVGSSTGVSIKRGVVEEIGVATPVDKGRKKKIKKEADKKSEVEEGVEGTKASQSTKKRKITSTHKQLTFPKDPREVDPSTAKKEASHPLIPNIRVNTKVETYILQIPVGSPKGVSFIALTFSAQGSSGYPAISPQSPHGPFGHTHSKQKTAVEPIERERRTRPNSFFSHPFSFS